MEAREKTNKLLEMIEHGLLKADHVVHCCLSYMSEDDVADMAHCNEFWLKKHNEARVDKEFEDDFEVEEVCLVLFDKEFIF